MKQNVLFLKAGSSKPFGIPLTNEILPLILDGLDNNELYNANEKYCSILRSFIYGLMPGLKENRYICSITDILSLIHYMLLHSISPSPVNKKKGLRIYRNLVVKALLEVLELPYTPQIEHLIPLELKKFVRWILTLSSEERLTVISTNYDISVELELYRIINDSDVVKKSIDFGFNWRVPFEDKVQFSSPDSLIRIFKLHGSTNWLKCGLCEHKYINTGGSIYHQAFREELDDYNTCTCGHGPLEPVVIAPSIERDIRDVDIINIWKNALEALRTADEWVMIGYSMPIEDLTIRTMLLRAYHGRQQKPKIAVVQKGMEAKDMYSLFFTDFVYNSKGLECFVNEKIEDSYRNN